MKSRSRSLREVSSCRQQHGPNVAFRCSVPQHSLRSHNSQSTYLFLSNRITHTRTRRHPRINSSFLSHILSPHSLCLSPIYLSVFCLLVSNTYHLSSPEEIVLSPLPFCSFIKLYINYASLFASFSRFFCEITL